MNILEKIGLDVVEKLLPQEKEYLVALDDLYQAKTGNPAALEQGFSVPASIENVHGVIAFIPTGQTYPPTPAATTTETPTA